MARKENSKTAPFDKTRVGGFHLLLAFETFVPECHIDEA
jgi:hypothetical protein